MKITIRFEEDGLRPSELKALADKMLSSIIAVDLVNGVKGQTGYRHGFVEGQVQYEGTDDLLVEICAILSEKGYPI